ncbi:MAG: adenylyltransferase/cytidyltransferase family protein, partial [Planctomycetota bacterium]|nr:adenylyltransferase/cytidyltransferase family protein [Planctomycetota bacterium]
MAKFQVARSQGERLVLCHGCFDLLHPGHVHHLREASLFGDKLFVSVTTDPHVNKGPGRPLIPQSLRVEAVEALRFVESAFVCPHPTAIEMIELLQPDVFVKGAEYEQSSDARFQAEQAMVEQYGGQVAYTSDRIVFSSTKLINAAKASEQISLIRTRLDDLGFTIESIENRIEAFRNQRVLVVGETIIDRYRHCTALDLGSNPWLERVGVDERVSYDGGAAIIARHLKAMGATPVLATHLPV